MTSLGKLNELADNGLLMGLAWGPFDAELSSCTDALPVLPSHVLPSHVQSANMALSTTSHALLVLHEQRSGSIEMHFPAHCHWYTPATAFLKCTGRRLSCWRGSFGGNWGRTGNNKVLCSSSCRCNKAAQASPKVSLGRCSTYRKLIWVWRHALMQDLGTHGAIFCMMRREGMCA